MAFVFRPRSLVAAALPLTCILASSGCDHHRKVMTPAQDNHPTINLFGFEESQLHHIHNTVELHRNLFLVRYDAASPNLIEWVNCPVSADYVYRKANGRRIESIHVRNFAELKARVPVNFARFEGQLRGGSTLEFNYVTIGSYELVGQFKIPANDPDCARATHYVVTLSVGAFSYGEGRNLEGGLAVEATGTGVGAGVTAGRETNKTTSVGDLQACMNDGTAFADCFTPLQFMMVPLAQRDWEGGVVVASNAGEREAVSEPDEARPVTSLALSIDPERWFPGSFMAQALEQVLMIASRIDETTEYGYDDVASTVVAGYLQPEKPELLLNRMFEAGQNYVVFATGSGSEADLDIEVFDASGEPVAADVEPDAYPTVAFTPTQTGDYTIRLSLAGPADDFGAMVVMREGGVGIRAEILQPAFQSLLDNAAQASQLVIEGGYPQGLGFHDSGWALNATILNPGEAASMTNLLLDQWSVALAVAHDPSFPLDLSVENTSTGEQLRSEDPSFPMVIVESPNPDARYSLSVGYGQGQGPTLATSLILRPAAG